jgi:hypothetical protein
MFTAAAAATAAAQDDGELADGQPKPTHRQPTREPREPQAETYTETANRLAGRNLWVREGEQTKIDRKDVSSGELDA